MGPNFGADIWMQMVSIITKTIIIKREILT